MIVEVFAKFLLGMPKKSRLQMETSKTNFGRVEVGVVGYQLVLVIGPSADLQGAQMPCYLPQYCGRWAGTIHPHWSMSG